MAFRNKKEQMQIIILVVVLAIIGGVVLFVNRERLLPKPVATESGMVPPARMELPSAYSDDIFKRPVFMALKEFGEVPVKPLKKGSTELFKELK